jgi:hypothetical protein
VFATALIVAGLAAVGTPEARDLAGRGAQLLARRAEPPGVWRFRAPGHPGRHGLPADVDDTACASMALQACGLPAPDNAPALLANRDPQGRFYTWIVARRGTSPLAGGLWRVHLRRAMRPVAGREAWRGAAAPGDVDVVVNANVLAYLGDGAHAGAVADWLVAALDAPGPRPPDKWYRSWFTFYYALARCCSRGIAAVAPAADRIATRIAAATTAEGVMGAGPQDTALGISALAHLGAPVPGGAVAFVRAAQDADGSWPAEPLYFAAEEMSWGSRALTTALCLEALARSSQAQRSSRRS